MVSRATLSRAPQRLGLPLEKTLITTERDEEPRPRLLAVMADVEPVFGGERTA